MCLDVFARTKGPARCFPFNFILTRRFLFLPSRNFSLLVSPLVPPHVQLQLSECWHGRPFTVRFW